MIRQVHGTAAFTASIRPGRRSHVTAVSKVSVSTPIATSVSRRYGARRNASRQAPPPPSITLAVPLAQRAGALDRLVRALEAEVQRGAVAAQRELRLARLDQPAVRRPHAGLHDLPHQLQPDREVVELDAGAPARLVARADPHPRLGDHRQRALRAEQQAVRRRARRRRRAAGATPRSRRAA